LSQKNVAGNVIFEKHVNKKYLLINLKIIIFKKYFLIKIVAGNVLSEKQEVKRPFLRNCNL
jgi:hypothetical protein